MTSETGDQLRFWAHLQLARIFYAKQGIMTHGQFDEIDWRSVHRTLHDLPRLFQVWAAKHVHNIVGTTKFLSYQDSQCKLCPSCQKCKETCHHVARCPEKGRAMAFDQSTHKVKRWLDSNNTHPDLRQLLLQYLRKRGTVTCIECSTNLDLPPIMQDLAESQDIIGWDNFAMGMVPKKLLQIQSAHPSQCNSGRTEKIDIRVHHTAAAGDTLPVDLQVRSGARLDHRDIDLDPQGQAAERDQPPVGTRTRRIGRRRQVLARM